jgi:hypothetical protein
MINIIILFGVLTLMAGIVIAIDPEYIFGFLKRYAGKLALHITTVLVRLLLGFLLITQSGVSKYPIAIEIIGWLSVIAAILFTVIGRTKFERLMSWALALTKPVSRIGGVVAILFGVFLIYAFI